MKHEQIVLDRNAAVLKASDANRSFRVSSTSTFFFAKMSDLFKSSSPPAGEFFLHAVQTSPNDASV